MILFCKSIPLILPYLYKGSYEKMGHDLKNWLFINNKLATSRQCVDSFEDASPVRLYTPFCMLQNSAAAYNSPECVPSLQTRNACRTQLLLCYTPARVVKASTERIGDM